MDNHIETLNKLYSSSSTSPEALAHLNNLVEFVRVIHKRSHNVRSWARKVNSIPTFRSRSIFNANYDSQGKLYVDLEYSEDFFLDEGTGLWGTSKKAIEDICWAIERLKHALGNPGLRKFIGVCDYAKCKTPFFIRRRIYLTPLSRPRIAKNKVDFSSRFLGIEMHLRWGSVSQTLVQPFLVVEGEILL
jgi:hypothetical protein